jgi:hypothetical protein
MASARKLGSIRLARWGLIPLAVAVSLIGITGPAGASGSPRAAAGTLANVRSVAGDSASFCGLPSTGHIDCRGNNAFGELGNGTTTNSYSDVPVAVQAAVVPSSAAQGAKGTASAASKGAIAMESSVSADWP